MSARYVYTAQGHRDEESGWLVGGVFSSLKKVCEYAEAWASDKPGLEVYVYKRPLNEVYPRTDEERGAAKGEQVTVFTAPPIFEDASELIA